MLVNKTNNKASEFEGFTRKAWEKHLQQTNFKLGTKEELVAFGKKADRNIIRLAMRLLGFEIKEGTYVKVAKEKIRKSAHAYYFKQATTKEWVVNAKINKPQAFFTKKEATYLFKTDEPHKTLKKIGKKLLPKGKIRDFFQNKRFRASAKKDYDYLIHDCQQLEKLLNSPILNKIEAKQVDKLIDRFSNYKSESMFPPLREENKPLASRKGKKRKTSPILPSIKKQQIFIALEAISKMEENTKVVAKKDKDGLPRKMEKIGKKAIDDFDKVRILLHTFQEASKHQVFEVKERELLEACQKSPDKVEALSSLFSEKLELKLKNVFGTSLAEQIMSPDSGYFGFSLKDSLVDPSFLGTEGSLARIMKLAKTFESLKTKTCKQYDLHPVQFQALFDKALKEESKKQTALIKKLAKKKKPSRKLNLTFKTDFNKIQDNLIRKVEEFPYYQHLDTLSDRDLKNMLTKEYLLNAQAKELEVEHAGQIQKLDENFKETLDKLDKKLPLLEEKLKALQETKAQHEKDKEEALNSISKEREQIQKEELRNAPIEIKQGNEIVKITEDLSEKIKITKEEIQVITDQIKNLREDLTAKKENSRSLLSQISELKKPLKEKKQFEDQIKKISEQINEVSEQIDALEDPRKSLLKEKEQLKANSQKLDRFENDKTALLSLKQGLKKTLETFGYPGDFNSIKSSFFKEIGEGEKIQEDIHALKNETKALYTEAKNNPSVEIKPLLGKIREKESKIKELELQLKQINWLNKFKEQTKSKIEGEEKDQDIIGAVAKKIEDMKTREAEFKKNEKEFSQLKKEEAADLKRLQEIDRELENLPSEEDWKEMADNGEEILPRLEELDRDTREILKKFPFEIPEDLKDFNFSEAYKSFMDRLVEEPAPPSKKSFLASFKEKLASPKEKSKKENENLKKLMDDHFTTLEANLNEIQSLPSLPKVKPFYDQLLSLLNEEKALLDQKKELNTHLETIDLTEIEAAEKKYQDLNNEIKQIETVLIPDMNKKLQERKNTLDQLNFRKKSNDSLAASAPAAPEPAKAPIPHATTEELKDKFDNTTKVWDKKIRASTKAIAKQEKAIKTNEKLRQDAAKTLEADKKALDSKLEKNLQKIEEEKIKHAAPSDNRETNLETLSKELNKTYEKNLRKLLKIKSNDTLVPSKDAFKKICKKLQVNREIIPIEKSFKKMKPSQFVHLYYQLTNLSKFQKTFETVEEGLPFFKEKVPDPIGQGFVQAMGLQAFSFDPELFPIATQGLQKAMQVARKVAHEVHEGASPYSEDQTLVFSKQFFERKQEMFISSIKLGNEFYYSEELEADMKRSFFFSYINTECEGLKFQETFSLFLYDRFQDPTILPGKHTKELIANLVAFAKEKEKRNYRPALIMESLENHFAKGALTSSTLSNQLSVIKDRKQVIGKELRSLKEKRKTQFDPDIVLENLITDPSRIFEVFELVLQPAMGHEAKSFSVFLGGLKEAFSDSSLLDELKKSLKEFQKGPYKKFLEDTAGQMKPDVLYKMLSDSMFNVLNHGITEALSFFEKFGDAPEEVVSKAEKTNDFTEYKKYQRLTHENPEKQMDLIGKAIAGEKWEKPLNKLGVDEYMKLNLDQKVAAVFVLPLLKGCYAARMEINDPSKTLELMEIEKTIKNVIATNSKFAILAKFHRGTTVAIKGTKFIDKRIGQKIIRFAGKKITRDIIKGLNLTPEKEKELDKHKEQLENVVGFLAPKLMNSIDEKSLLNFMGELYDYSRGSKGVYLNEIGLDYLNIIQKWTNIFHDYTKKLDGGTILFKMMEEKESA